MTNLWQENNPDSPINLSFWAPVIGHILMKLILSALIFLPSVFFNIWLSLNKNIACK